VADHFRWIAEPSRRHDEAAEHLGHAVDELAVVGGLGERGTFAPSLDAVKRDMQEKDFSVAERPCRRDEGSDHGYTEASDLDPLGYAGDVHHDRNVGGTRTIRDGGATTHHTFAVLVDHEVFIDQPLVEQQGRQSP
jgi:hypothetical protein